MKHDWLNTCFELSQEPADFYSGARKILRNRHFSIKRIRDDLTMADAGYARQKMTMLTKNYLHEESKAVAIDLWEKRLGQRKYGSVSFTTFNHFVKGGSVDAKRSKRASVFGPCIQSVSLTWVNTDRVEVDVFYRTTELLKKFPADLVFIRDVLLDGFRFDETPLRAINFHFANVTVHPMYWVTIAPLLKDPMRELEEIRKADEYFFNWVVKWTARYLCPEHHRGIQKFAQAMRVCTDARKRISPDVMPSLIAYLNEHHPGYRSEYVDPDQEEEDQ